MARVPSLSDSATVDRPSTTIIHFLPSTTPYRSTVYPSKCFQNLQALQSTFQLSTDTTTKSVTVPENPNPLPRLQTSPRERPWVPSSSHKLNPALPLTSDEVSSKSYSTRSTYPSTPSSPSLLGLCLCFKVQPSRSRASSSVTTTLFTLSGLCCFKRLHNLLRWLL